MIICTHFCSLHLIKRALCQYIGSLQLLGMTELMNAEQGHFEICNPYIVHKVATYTAAATLTMRLVEALGKMQKAKTENQGPPSKTYPPLALPFLPTFKVSVCQQHRPEL